MKQASIVPFLLSIVVSVSKINVLKGLLCSATVDGCPFSSVEDGLLRIGFALVMERLPLKINRRNIVDIVELAANNIREQVASILKKSLVSVKVDGVTRFSRSYLGMNVQVQFAYR